MASAHLLKADVYSEYFPNPLLSFIGTNQIRDCAAYPRRAQNRVHKIKLATAFVFGGDVGARRFRLGTLQIFPNHGKSILATDGITLEAEELNSGEAAWANLARRLRRDKSGGTYDKSIFVEASCPRFAAPIAPDWPLADLP